jgi:hypothetical protein
MEFQTWFDYIKSIQPTEFYEREQKGRMLYWSFCVLVELREYQQDSTILELGDLFVFVCLLRDEINQLEFTPIELTEYTKDVWDIPLRYYRGDNDDLYLSNLHKFCLGILEFVLSEAQDTHGCTLQEIMEANYSKLKARVEKHGSLKKDA